MSAEHDNLIPQKTPAKGKPVVEVKTEGEKHWSRREPTIRQRKAVDFYLGENGGITKGEALRKAGYSEKMIANPDRVFNSVAVRQRMEKVGLTEELGFEVVKSNMKAHGGGHMVFPPFRNPEDRSEENGENALEVKGEQMTDGDIRDFFAGIGQQVYRIVHGEQARHVYFYVPNSKAQLDAADKLFNLLGSYAPRKVEGKHEHLVGVATIGDLRRMMREKGLNVIDPEDEESEQNQAN